MVGIAMQKIMMMSVGAAREPEVCVVSSRVQKLHWRVSAKLPDIYIILKIETQGSK